MKRNYFEPEMKISTFSMENVVTTSINNASINNSANENDYNATSAKAILSYTDFTF